VYVLYAIRKLLALLLAVTTASYLAINVLLVGVGAPLFLLLENTAYAVLYAIGLLAMMRSRIGSAYYVAALAWFNTGRVSRTIITPRGELGPLAAEHIPLLTLLASIALLSTLLAYRGQIRC
jgi:hypothetical protein